jgi:hypothetical protein
MEAEDRKTQTKRIFNPTSDDFTVSYAGVPYTILSHDMKEFPIEIADHVQKHLVTHILNKKGSFTEQDRQDALKKTEVEL